MSKAPAKTQIVWFRLKLHACDTERMRGTIEKEENGSTENLFFSSPSRIYRAMAVRTNALAHCWVTWVLLREVKIPTLCCSGTNYSNVMKLIFLGKVIYDILS